MKKFKLAIFDLDGTLFDTKFINFNAYKKAFELCNIEAKIDFDFYCSYCNGNNYKDFLPKIINNISEVEMEKIHLIKKDTYKDYLSFAKINNHLISFIDLISSEYYTGIVTTASKQNTNDILTKFQVKDKFDFIITKEDVNKTKPNPEGFIKAMEIAGITKENTIIFEDSSTGLLAAKNSGAKYVQVYGFN